MNRLKVTLSTLALGLALGQAANAQLTLELEGRITTQAKAMKVVDRDGMITKKDPTAVLEKKFDAMSNAS